MSMKRVIAPRLMLAAIAGPLSLVGCGDSPRTPSPPTAPPADVRGASIDGSDDHGAAARKADASAKGSEPDPGVTPESEDEQVPDHVVLSAAELAKYVPPPPSSDPIELTAEESRIISGALTQAAESAAGGQFQPVGKPDRDRAGFLGLTWDEMVAFHFELTGLADRLRSAKPEEVLPKRLLELDGKQVSISGFVMPLAVQGGRCSSFMLVRNRLFCCFGAPLGLTDWVMVEMDEGKSIAPVQDVPTMIFGKLAVKPQTSDGLVLSLLELRGTDSVVEKQR